PVRSSASRPRATSRLIPRRRRTHGWCSRPVPWRRTRRLSRSTSAASGRKARSIATCVRATCSSRSPSRMPAKAPCRRRSPVPEPAAERGFKIARTYYTLDGKPADPTRAKQNDRFAVVLKIPEPQPQFARIIVADYLPAGFEIDNPRLVSSGDTGTLAWITDAQEPVNAEFRDDRFSAAFERKSGDPSVFTVAYVVRVVSPGRYVHPQAYVEDMYRPDRFGRTATGTIEVTAAK